MALRLQPNETAGSAPRSVRPQKQAAHVTARLVSENSELTPGQTAWLGVDLKIEPKWHIYWPGQNDTGMAPTLQITAPSGFTTGPTTWPAPQRHLAPGDILDHIYENQVLLMIPVEVPKNAEPGSSAKFSVQCKWLVCADVCLPEQATVAITIPVITPDTKPKISPDTSLFALARQRVPIPLKSDSGTTARTDHRTFVVESKDATKLSFFPAEDSAPMPYLAKEGVATAGKLSIQIEPESPKARVKGVIEVVRKGEKQPAFYSVDLEVPHE
jgi:thiol:disulfide interchange protein DsbD